MKVLKWIALTILALLGLVLAAAMGWLHPSWTGASYAVALFFGFMAFKEIDNLKSSVSSLEYLS